MLGIAGELVATGLAAGAATAGTCYATFWPTCAIWGPVVARGSTAGQPRVALTFDDGPLPGATDPILDVLAELKVRAAFFVIGKVAEKNQGLLRRIDQEGHVVGNHSYDHPGWGFLHGKQFWREQLTRTDQVIAQTIGVRPRFFRPPLGMKTWFVARAARGHMIVTWTLRGMDGIGTSSRRILDRLLPRGRPGDIIALHDGVSPQSRRDPAATVNAIRPLILGLRARGIEPVGLDELTGLKAYRDPE